MEKSFCSIQSYHYGFPTILWKTAQLTVPFHWKNLQKTQRCAIYLSWDFLAGINTFSPAFSVFSLVALVTKYHFDFFFMFLRLKMIQMLCLSTFHELKGFKNLGGYSPLRWVFEKNKRSLSFSSFEYFLLNWRFESIC